MSENSIAKNSIAKSAPVPQEAEKPVAHPALKEQIAMYEDFPIDFMRYFNMEFNGLTDSSKKHLREIYKDLSGDGVSMGDIMRKMRDIEAKVGQPAYGETRHAKVYNYIKIDKQIQELMKKRDSLHGK